MAASDARSRGALRCPQSRPCLPIRALPASLHRLALARQKTTGITGRGHLLKTGRRNADETRESASAAVESEGSSMDTAQFERLDVDQAASILLWRFRKLTEAGHDTVRALMMA